MIYPQFTPTWIALMLCWSSQALILFCMQFWQHSSTTIGQNQRCASLLPNSTSLDEQHVQEAAHVLTLLKGRAKRALVLNRLVA